ncbi:chaperone protein [Nannochloropsis gaditana]|uniref:Chaperone protein n=1 Tax=Nannochloropsis gaditana TaxID=72520 RepID=W7TRF1_9STRA|nr:chaperone protein [Nannochloropsis gaditana]
MPSVKTGGDHELSRRKRKSTLLTSLHAANLCCFGSAFFLVVISPTWCHLNYLANAFVPLVYSGKCQLHNFRAASSAGTMGPQLCARPRRAAQRVGAIAMRVKFDVKKDYYARLDIEKSASLNDIKRAYRRLALQTHPDVNKAPDAAETFKQVCEAYKVLSDAEARKGYDLARGMQGSGFGSGGRRWTNVGGRGTASSSSSSSRGWYDQYGPFGGGAPGANEETAESIDDSFSSIFRDFVGNVGSNGGRGFLEDVVSFLESNVDGFSEESDAEFEEILKGEDLQLVQDEIENLNFLIPKLREKQQQAKIDVMVAQGKLRTLQAAAARDLEGVDRQLEAVEKVAATQARVKDLEGHMKRADKRQRRLMLRAEELRWGAGGRSAYSKYASPGTKGSASSRSNTGERGERVGGEMRGRPPPRRRRGRAPGTGERGGGAPEAEEGNGSVRSPWVARKGGEEDQGFA